MDHFNRTLKVMLRKVRKGENRDWDPMLPYVLFAYWEVPQVTVGFSLFELLYGSDPPKDHRMCYERNGSRSLRKRLTTSVM